ncbi:MAG: CDP-glucose 4,6-dehydratase [candidate division WS2 bacterium ADurb.Bin280]|uniref:CDP-glucose 4,6-dehydratase n=1 Tax=candidate division WS2 bacterium ADurb.Bin280 TaxID=1852829 RepID=A0A1V5SFE9_9BACT|nr:MAG: CDP-glucose 4,6-dehydratase [candidate division WS2 bacterium ADurb.Bin280]
MVANISLKQLRKVYGGKSVLVTGHTGFKGAWLTQILILSGARVTGYALNPPTKPSLFKALKLKNKIRSVNGDIRNLKRLHKVVCKSQPDIIFHLAAQPLVRESYQDPIYTYQTNLIGTANVLEVIRQEYVKAGVIITTDKVYENAEQKEKLYCESDKLGGRDPYSSSKACADLCCDCYNKSFLIDQKCFVASARSGNVIGGGDWAKDRLIPDAVRAFFENRDPLLIRMPHSIRPWQHVFEPIGGYLLLGAELLKKNPKAIGSWNFAPEPKDMLKVCEIVDKFIRSSGAGSYRVDEPKKKLHEARYLRLSNKKAKSKLGYKPVFCVDEAIELTAQWYRAYYQGKDIVEFSIKQIKQYFK